MMTVRVLKKSIKITGIANESLREDVFKVAAEVGSEYDYDPAKMSCKIKTNCTEFIDLMFEA